MMRCHPVTRLRRAGRAGGRRHTRTGRLQHPPLVVYKKSLDDYDIIVCHTIRKYDDILIIIIYIYIYIVTVV